MHSSNSDASLPSPGEEKREAIGAQVEAIHTNERVPGNTHYYEKNGLRTYGDDEDHDHEPPVCAALHTKPEERRVLIDIFSDDPSPDHVLGCHGLPLDWLADSCLPVR